MQTLKEAISIAKEHHKGFKRKSGEDYFIHPKAVMDILKGYGFPRDVLICAILHDIIEDTNITNIEISQKFGERVGFILYALSKNKKPKPNKELHEKYKREGDPGINVHPKKEIKNFKDYYDYNFFLYVNRLYMSVVADPWIVFIKMADHMHNTSTLKYLDLEKQKRKIIELEQYYLPLYRKAKEIISPANQDKYRRMLKRLLKIIEKEKLRIKEEEEKKVD
jgi:GTP pyrophosphokinase